MISDEYNSAETYAKGNLCIYNGKIYEAIKETTGTWDATAWEETTLAKVNGKLNGDIISLSEKTTMSWSGIDTDVVLTTKAWTQADGGFSWSVPTTGWYYLQAKFTKTKDGSDYTGDMQFHLKSKKNDGIRYNTISKLSSMTVVELNTVVRLVEGDKIFPNVHTAQAGLKLNTRLFVVLLNKI